MIGVVGDVSTGLSAALRLARGRPDGIVLLDTLPEERRRATARSFWAGALCVPALLLLELVGWLPDGPPPNAGHEVLATLLSMIVTWAGFAVLSHELCGAIGSGARWWRFMAAWNWCSVVQFALLACASVPLLIGLPAWIGQAAWLIAVGWGLWLEWFATRLALDLGPLTAAGFVVLDFVLTIGLDRLQDSLSQF